jgi:deazaflavin-dependent oxidoreductase (nitroreductase family)
MPLTGEYERGTMEWAANQAERIMESGGTEGTTALGMPVILLTTIGNKTGKLRKTPLMRVECKGEYAVVASLAGAPNHPVWYYNIIADPHVELQDGTVANDYTAREVSVRRKHCGGSAPSRRTRRTPTIRARPPVRSRSSS